MRVRRGIVAGTLLGCALVAGVGSVTAHAQANILLQVMMTDIGLPGYVNAVKTTVEPGKKSAPHSHTGRISVQIILQGTAIEHRGDQVLTHETGEIYSVPEGSTHWFENTGTVPMTYAEVNIRPKGPEAGAPTPAAAPAK